jgi:hypothetical protein
VLRKYANRTQDRVVAPAPGAHHRQHHHAMQSSCNTSSQFAGS